MTISVIIPVYNGENTIKETIESVVNQTFTDLEIIIINDGSTDSTVEIVKNIPDTRIQLHSYPNAGLAASRNRGISCSQGELISFIDADDLWTPDKLAAQYQKLQEHPQVAVAYSWTDYIDSNSQFLQPGRHVSATGNVFSKLLMWSFLENGSNPLIRREAIETVGGFDESLCAAEDWDMWLRLAAKYEFVCVEKPQILYRVSGNSMSANLKRQEGACLQVIERGFNHPQAESLQHLKKYSFAHLYKYLAFKALQAPPEKRNSLISAQFLWNSIKYNPSVLKQVRVMSIAMLKIVFPRISDRVREIFRQT
jgi:glycosyltransferase involved in cell wall biosynthesis